MKKILTILLLSITCNALAQLINPNWVKQYDRVSLSADAKITNLPNNEFLLVHGLDHYTINANGDSLNKGNFNGKLDPNGLNDIITDNNNIFIGGVLNGDPTLVKLDLNYNTIWSKSIVNQSFASTTIYKSTDNGITFITDSVGHPRMNIPAQCAGFPMAVANVFVLNGKLINVINGGFYSKYPSDPSWIKTTDPNVTFGELFGEYNNTWYVWSDNYKLHTSIDSGQTWTTPTNAGLPPLFHSKVMNINFSSGRIYIAGSSLSTSEYKLLYSDNEGLSWDSLPINQYLGLDWINQKQKILGMISNGNEITAS